MKVSRCSVNTAPLCFLPDGRLLCYSGGKVFVISEGSVEKLFSVPISYKEKMLGRSRLLSRLLRFGVRAAQAIDDNNVLLSIGNRIHELNIEAGTMTEGWYCGEGIRPLVLNLVQGIEGFEDGVYFGGYLHNHEMNPVHIYHRKGVDDWEVVYTFSQGIINHVHNVLADTYRNCLWIFTGDFGEAAAIWKVTKMFNKVERIVGGDQRWRGSVGFVLPEGLLYATDTPRADNFLYLLNPDTFEQKTIMPLDGSCIYGCQWKDNYVLSTTVESNGGNMGFFENWFGRKRGDGINDDYFHMYCGNLENGFDEINKEKKDWLPFTLFQFGAFKFPAGVNDTETLYFQPVGSIKNDQGLMAIDKNNIKR